MPTYIHACSSMDAIIDGVEIERNERKLC